MKNAIGEGIRRGGIRVILFAIAGILLSLSIACTLFSRGVRAILPKDTIEATFGIISISPPTAISFEELKEEFIVDTKALDFDKALTATESFQSVGVRRREVQQQAGATGSADLVQLALLAAKLKAGQIPDTIPAPPPAPTPNLTPNADFSKLPAQSVTPAVGLSRRLQVAFNNVVEAKLLGATSTVYSKLQKNYDIKFVFNQLTVIPGTRASQNAHAEVRTLWKVKDGKSDPPGPNDPDVVVVPIFPTYDGVGELNDAASLDQTLLFLMAVIQAGPSQVTPQYQRLVTDIRQLVSATQRVTLIGSATSNGCINYSVNGERTALPFQEKRPTGTDEMQPLVLPMVTIVMVRKSRFAEHPVGVELSYSSRWVRESRFLSQIPPENFVPGVFYDRGTNFEDPKCWDQLCLANEFEQGTVPARSFSPKAITFKAAESPLSLPLVLASAPNSQPYNPLTQVLTINTAGTSPLEFYLENVPLASKRVDSKDLLAASFVQEASGTGLRSSPVSAMRSGLPRGATTATGKNHGAGPPSTGATPTPIDQIEDHVEKTIDEWYNPLKIKIDSTVANDVVQSAYFKYTEIQTEKSEPTAALKALVRAAVLTPSLVQEVVRGKITYRGACLVARHAAEILWTKTGNKVPSNIDTDLESEAFNTLSKVPQETYLVLVPTDLIRNLRASLGPLPATLSAVNGLGPAIETLAVDLSAVSPEEPLAPLTDRIQSIHHHTDATGKQSESDIELIAPRGSFWPPEVFEVIDPIPEPHDEK